MGNKLSFRLVFGFCVVSTRKSPYFCASLRGVMGKNKVLTMVFLFMWSSLAYSSQCSRAVVSIDQVKEGAKSEVGAAILSEVKKLNRRIISDKNPPKSLEALYLLLKAEEGRWLTQVRSYDFKKEVPESLKSEILSNYKKIDPEKLKTNDDFYLFYLNQVRFLYFQAAKKIYEKWLFENQLEPQSGKESQLLRVFYESFFSSELESISLKEKDVQATFESQPWKNFDLPEVQRLVSEWSRQEDQGVRNLMSFMAEAAEGRFNLSKEELSYVERTLMKSKKEICCKTSCRNCILNRHFFKR